MTPTLRRPRSLVISIAVGALAVAVVVGVIAGTSGIAPGRVLYEVLDRLTPGRLRSGLNLRERNIVWQLRMPRVVLAGMVGAMLSLAGASFQGVFRNPLVDPYLLGAAAGAGLGATVAIAYMKTLRNTWPVDPIVALGFAGAVLAVIVGSKPLPRSAMTKKLWDYIKKNNLQDAKKRTQINADPALKAVFGGKKQVSMFEMTKLVSAHVK